MLRCSKPAYGSVYVCNKWFFSRGTHFYMSLFSICRSVCCAPYLRNCRSCNHKFCCTCVKWWDLQDLFSFFLSFNFWVVSGTKRQKMVQNVVDNKKCCPPHPIPQETYMTWLSFVVMKQQLMTIDATKKLVTKFFFFHCLIKLVFACCNPKKILENNNFRILLSATPHTSGNIHDVIVICGTHV